MTKPLEGDLLDRVDQPQPQPAKRKVRGGHQPGAGTKPTAPTTASGVNPVAQLPALREDVRPQTFLALIASAAADPRVDPAKMSALVAIHKEIKADAAREAFTQAYIELQHELPSITATGRIVIEGKSGKRGQNTPYATFNEINRVTKPILKQHGFALRFEPDVGADGKIVMRGTLEHIGGHSASCAMSLPLETSGSKNNVQGVGSSISYGKRYCAIALLNIVSHAPEDADLDGNEPSKVVDEKPITAPQLAELTERIQDSGAALENVLASFEIDALKDLPAHRFNEAIQRCANFKAFKERGAH